MRALLLVALLLITACVPKGKYEDALDWSASLQQELKDTQAALADAQAGAQALQTKLEGEQARSAELEALAKQLEEDNAGLRAHLDELSGLVADLSTRNKAERQAKSDLEALVADLKAGSQAAEARLSGAQERLAALRAEQQRLEAEQAEMAAEQARLKAEADRLRAEREALAKRTQAYDDLVDSLRGEIADGQVTITELSGKLTVSLSNAILFDSGSYALKTEGKDALTRVAGVLAGIQDREIRVEGHTDDDAVRGGAAYKDNWALSSLRASTVTALLVEGGVDPLNIAAVGFGEFHPVASNENAQGKARNRRTEIVLVPRLASVGDGIPEGMTIEDSPQ